ncbi:hypothetical protein INT44_004637 [Umbelopsis vinacea]|uniref:Uncharacterized protein n=1 Tax=Umbelopsis vinacea TaxID=44442 RepID=A0A8H7QCU6_9FUNG|nr:hypothetical protein INT44_004637 [Umbelopsis vinacea]
MQSIIPAKRKKKRQSQKPSFTKATASDSHTLHWALCDFYLESSNLPPIFCQRSHTTQCTASSNSLETDRNVQFAISTLQDLLTTDIKAKAELVTRLALTKLVIRYTKDWELADENLRMVFRKMGKGDRSQDTLGFEAINLRCQFFIQKGGASCRDGVRKLLEAAIEQAKSRGRISWIYEFYLKLIEITGLNGLQKECTDAINDGIILARKRGDDEMLAVFLLAMARFSMAWNKINDMGLALTQVESICASKSSTETFQPIIAYHQALNILYYTLSGNSREAHSSARKANRMDNVMSADLTIPEEGTESVEVIRIRWLSKPGMKAIHCLISGLSYLHDTSSTKAKDYFELGIATISGETEQYTNTLSQLVTCITCNGVEHYPNFEGYCHLHTNAVMFMVSIQLHLQEHLMYYHLSICDYDEAKKVLDAMKQSTSRYDVTPLTLTVRLSTAMYLQSVGDFTAARKEYEYLLQCTENDFWGKYPDKASIISFCLFLMQPFEKQLNNTECCFIQMRSLIGTLKSHIKISDNSKDALNCILCISNSLDSLQTGTIVDVKSFTDRFGSWQYAAESLGAYRPWTDISRNSA